MLLTLGALFCSCNNGENVKLRNQNDSINWVIGQSMAQGMQESGFELDEDIILQAVKNTLRNKPQPIDDDTYRSMLQYINFMVMQNQKGQMEGKLDEVRKAESSYFADLCKKNTKVVKDEKGFYYEVISEGKGATAQMGQVVDFDYKAYFTNGQLFDQTVGQREPIHTVIGNQMFAGLRDGLCTMKKGATYKFYFPSELAFGAQGNEDIPPYTMVIYEVTLHEISNQ